MLLDNSNREAIVQLGTDAEKSFAKSAQIPVRTSKRPAAIGAKRSVVGSLPSDGIKTSLGGRGAR
jgi:hypothetical protein